MATEVSHQLYISIFLNILSYWISQEFNFVYRAKPKKNGRSTLEGKKSYGRKQQTMYILWIMIKLPLQGMGRKWQVSGPYLYNWREYCCLYNRIQKPIFIPNNQQYRKIWTQQNLPDLWYFATSYGICPCDGIGGTIKHLVAWACL